MISLADSLYRLANLVLAVSALGVAALIVRTIHRRVSRRVEPLGVVVALVFVAIGLMAAVRVWAVPVLPADTVETLSARILVQEHRLYPDAIRRITEEPWHLEGRRVVFGRRA